jgi:hypothetical protein
MVIFKIFEYEIIDFNDKNIVINDNKNNYIISINKISFSNNFKLSYAATNHLRQGLKTNENLIIFDIKLGYINLK